MTVGELIKRLSKLPPELEVILQADPEGNGYDKLRDIDANCIVDLREQTSWSTNWNHEDAGFETEKEWDSFKRYNSKCVILAP